MISFKRKGVYTNRKLFIQDNGSIYVILVVDKKSQRRYKKYLKKYHAAQG